MKDKLFILLTKEEFEKNKYLDIIKKGNNVYNNDKYIVLIYDKEAYWKMVNKS